MICVTLFLHVAVRNSKENTAMRESHAKRASQKIHGQQVMGGSSGRATGDGARGHNRTAGPGDALAGGGGGASISPGVAPAQG